MNFTEVVDEVVRILKRPDKKVDVQREVNAAINFCCTEANFARDRQEQSVDIDATLYAQNIPLSTFTRFRKVDCIRPANRNKLLQPLDPSKIFTPKGCETLDVYYLAGDQINFKLATLASSLLVAYFSYPPTLTDTAATFWLLEQSPYMIINKAAAVVFDNIGDEKAAAKHLSYFALDFTSAKRDYKYGYNVG